jgi:glycosyltransferase involved in cell wall biosynthesis
VKASKITIWAHDILFVAHNMRNVDITPEELIIQMGDRITNCVTLTNWHKNLFLKEYPMLEKKIKIINNGIDTSLFNYPTDKKVKNSFVYSSRPERGLERIISLWDSILSLFPDATLNVASYVEYTEQYQKLIHDKKNVNYLGNLNQPDLYKLLAHSEFWFYPVTYYETSCITAMEMLQSEVIPVYYPVGGLVDTLNGNGIAVIPGNEIDNLKIDEHTKITLRKRGKEYTTEECSWASAYEKWKKIL